MMQDASTNNPRTDGLGLEFKPGDEHYRAYVGPPGDYDLVAAMAFNLLTCLGLRQHHRLLDIGCGSLRVGRILMPYLNASQYYGVEPNRWLVEDGIANEIGIDLVRIKKPTFVFSSTMEEFKEPLDFDYALAQSIFSHCGENLIKQWLSEISFHLKDNAALLATFLIGTEDYRGQGWKYPGCVRYKPGTLAGWAAEFGLDFSLIDWAHPRQAWALFSKEKFDRALVDSGPVSWNRLVAAK